jgi:hypothetical protein
MSRPFSLSRRAVLRGASGLALALPWLEAMGQTATPPKRVLFMFTPNGTVPANFWPTGGETSWVTSKILQPLDKHHADLLILKGLNMISATNGPGESHTRGIGHLLTGHELLQGPDKNGAGLGGAISVDQAIANLVGTTTLFKSLELGVVGYGTSGYGSVDAWSRLNFTGPGMYAPVENNPWSAFSRVFSNLPMSGAPPTMTVDPALLRKQSIVDAVLPSYRSLSSKLGGADQQRLDQHLALVEAMQAKLKQMPMDPPPPANTCSAPTLGATFDYKSDNLIPQTGQLQMSIIAHAFACGLTRVASLQWSRAYGLAVMGAFVKDSDGSAITGAHHELSHDTGATAQRQLTFINTWYAQQLSSLIDTLKAIPEGSGSVFDNTLIVWGNELGEGASHTVDDIPFVLAGRLGGTLRTGRFLQYGGKPHNNLLVSLLNAFGINQNTFGNPAYCTGALGSLT